jgi:hypothetical protein
MKAEIHGKYMFIRLKLIAPRLSSSGKKLLVATSRGPRPAKFKIKGRIVSVNANAYIDLNPGS